VWGSQKGARAYVATDRVFEWQWGVASGSATVRSGEWIRDMLIDHDPPHAIAASPSGIGRPSQNKSISNRKSQNKKRILKRLQTTLSLTLRNWTGKRHQQAAASTHFYLHH
jgi:hypothetical protein